MSNALSTNALSTLSEIWGRKASTLLEQLCEARNAVLRLALIEETLLQCLMQSRSNAPSVSIVAHGLIAQAGGRMPISALTDLLGVGDRRLHRRFIDEIGLAPKYCARVMRLQTLIRTSLEPRCWAEAASALGFSDQAHPIGDFRDFMGTPPGRFFEDADFVAPLVDFGWLLTPRV